MRQYIVRTSVLPRCLRVPVASTTRLFVTSSILYKDEDKSKQALKKLGLSLQKGNLKPQEEDEENQPEKPSGSSKEPQDLEVTATKPQISPEHTPEEYDAQATFTNLFGHEENPDKIQQVYESIAYMTMDDLLIQQNLDQGRQFNSFPSQHYIDRKAIIRSLPNEIDIFNTPMSTIEDVYKKLNSLDEDKSVQLKYFKRYLKNYDDLVVQLLQQFNKINDKFKLLRRREIDNLALAPNAFLYKENLCNVPYNVMGFDRSITGLPLRSGKHELTEKCYPQEFIEDLQMFRTKLPLHKRDLNFIEIEDESENIDPSKLSKSHNSPKFELDKFINSLYEELEFPKNTLHVKDISNYKNLEVNSTFLINEIEYELLQFKKLLQKEIELFMASSGSKVLIFGNQDLKPNQFKLGESDTKGEKSNAAATNNSHIKSLVIINYNFKHFNLIPGYGMLLNSRRQYRFLYKHIFKIFLINLEDQIDTLFRIKYYNQKRMKKFMANVHLKIHNLLTDRIMKLAKDKSVLKNNRYAVDAVLHKPNSNNAFKRIYWINHAHRKSVAPMRPSSSHKHKKQSISVSFTDFNQFILQLQQPMPSVRRTKA